MSQSVADYLKEREDAPTEVRAKAFETLQKELWAIEKKLNELVELARYIGPTAVDELYAIAKPAYPAAIHYCCRICQHQGEQGKVCSQCGDNTDVKGIP